MYSDFQCPYCGKFALEVLPKIELNYVAPGRVRVVFKHLPLDSIHPFAVGAAEAAECAALEGRFWPMHDLLFKNSTALGPDKYLALARDLRLNERAFTACLDGAVSAKVKSDSSVAQQLGFNSTPILLIGTFTPAGTVRAAERLNGASDEKVVTAIIDKLLSASRRPAP